MENSNEKTKTGAHAETPAAEEKKPQTDSHSRAFAFILTAVVSMGIGAGALYLSKRKQIEFAERYPMMLEIEDFMVNEAGADVPDAPTDDEQINAYLSLYGDKYTYSEKVDITSKEFIADNVNASSSAVGTGFEISFNSKGRLYFSKIIADMPADRQGFKKGDIIVSIDGSEVSEFGDAKALKSAEKKAVSLVIERGGSQETAELELIPDEEKVVDNASYKMYGDVLYIDYNSVGAGTESIIRNALESNDFGSIIIDMRDNHGGESSVAVHAADMFIDKASVYYYRKDDSLDTTMDTEDGKLTDAPVVLLTNEKTASAAEIFTALLKQYDDATIVGTNTFGKGIFQNVATFHRNVIHYTDGYFKVGDWDCWQGVGIAPDIDVEMDSALIGTSEDVQLQKALELLS